jgi:hypothetical protein
MYIVSVIKHDPLLCIHTSSSLISLRVLLWFGSKETDQMGSSERKKPWLFLRKRKKKERKKRKKTALPLFILRRILYLCLLCNSRRENISRRKEQKGKKGFLRLLYSVRLQFHRREMPSTEASSKHIAAESSCRMSGTLACCCLTPNMVFGLLQTL